MVRGDLPATRSHELRRPPGRLPRHARGVRRGRGGGEVRRLRSGSDDFAREHELYRLLGGCDELLAPRLLAHGVIEAGQEWPYLIMQKLPGRRIGEVWAEITPRTGSKLRSG